MIRVELGLGLGLVSVLRVGLANETLSEGIRLSENLLSKSVSAKIVSAKIVSSNRGCVVRGCIIRDHHTEKCNSLFVRDERFHRRADVHRQLAIELS